MIVLGFVGQSRERAEVGIAQAFSRLDVDDRALVLIRLALPLALPGDRAALLEVARDVRPEHVLLDGLGIDERVPYARLGCVEVRLGFGDQVAVHSWLLEKRAAWLPGSSF